MRSFSKVAGLLHECTDLLHADVSHQPVGKLSFVEEENVGNRRHIQLLDTPGSVRLSQLRQQSIDPPNTGNPRMIPSDYHM